MNWLVHTPKLEIHVIDPDPQTREGLQALLGTLNAEVKTYISAERFLSQPLSEAPGCIIAEVNLPGMSGIELLERLHSRGSKLPAILLSRQSDVPTAVRAMQTGAVDFLEKPFVDRALMKWVKKILERSS
jgi:FixJ family two-component response regulator